jgi:hypothetical protein
MKIRGGVNMGKDFYRMLNVELDAVGAPRPAGPRKDKTRIGKLAKALRLTPRQMKRRLRETSRRSVNA